MLGGGEVDGVQQGRERVEQAAALFQHGVVVGQAVGQLLTQFADDLGGGARRLGRGLRQALDLGDGGAGVGVGVLGDVARGLGQRVADFLLAAGGGGAGLLPFLAQRGGHAGQRSGPGVQAGLVAGDQVALQGDGGLGRLGGGID